MNSKANRADFKVYYCYGWFLVNLTDKFFVIKDLVGVKLMRQLFELLCNQERYLLTRPYEVDEFIYHCQADLEDNSDSDRWFWLMKPEEYQLANFQDDYLLDFLPDECSIVDLQPNDIDEIYRQRVALLIQISRQFERKGVLVGQKLIRKLFEVMLIQDDLSNEQRKRYRTWFEQNIDGDNDRKNAKNNYMSEAYYQQIREILNRVEQFIYDDQLSPRQIGSYLTGGVMLQDDYDMLIDFCQELEVLAEQGSDLEVMDDDSPYLALMLAKARATFELIKFKVDESRLEKKRRWAAIFKAMDEDYYYKEGLAAAVLTFADVGELDLAFGGFIANQMKRHAENIQDNELTEAAKNESFQALYQMTERMKVWSESGDPEVRGPKIRDIQ